ncbi:MAG TPA: hypothetical protein VII97_11695 [Anaerolineales bacterium]
MNKKVFFALAVLVLVALACSFTTVNTPTASGGGNGQQILFQDDFTNVNSGWDHSATQNGTADYANGGYEIHITATSLSMWANSSKEFQNDVRIEVDATKTGGPDDNAFGMQCRYQDVDNYYYFYISSDGYVGIGVNNAGTKTIISSSDGNLTSDSSINQGAATNHLRVDCIGNTLTLFVNGTQVATATDSTFTGGDVGLMARTYSVGGTDIMFHNFFVYKP